jgi:hypothetical protein
VDIASASGSRRPGANPTIASYNAAGSLVRFDNKKVFFHLKNTLAYYNAGVVVVNLEVVGLGPGLESVQGIKFLGK